jgi:hypothetical protein
MAWCPCELEYRGPIENLFIDAPRVFVADKNPLSEMMEKRIAESVKRYTGCLGVYFGLSTPPVQDQNGKVG